MTTAPDRPPLTAAATLLVARHGDAEYGAHGVLSDEGGWLTDKGVQQCEALAQQLLDAGTPVAAVYSSVVERARESAEVAGKALSLTPTPVDGLQEFAIGDFLGRPYADADVQGVLNAWYDGKLSAACPDAEDGYALVDRFSRALDAIAAAHPGETVLVFSHGGVMSVVIPRIAQNTPNDLAKAHFLPNAVPVTMTVDRDRWSVVSWPGTTDPHSV